MRLIVVLFLLSLVVVYCINGPLSLRIGSDLDIRRNIVEERQPTGNVDTSLYSRQLFVYGESAQIKLKNAQVVLIGNYSLAYEIGKNLALAGVGNLFVCAAFAGGAASQQHSKPSIIAQHQSLVEYLKELNPGIQVWIMVKIYFFPDILISIFQVHRLDSDGAQSFQAFFRSHNISTVIAAGADISMLKKLDGSCQAHNVKLVACNTYGVCGFVFNDFLRDFIVSDTTGEAVKEVHHSLKT